MGTLTKTPDCCTYVRTYVPGGYGPDGFTPDGFEPDGFAPDIFTYVYTADMGSRPNREIPYPGVQAREFYPRGRDLGDIKRLVLKRARIRTYIHVGTPWREFVRTYGTCTYVRISHHGFRTRELTYVCTFLWALRVPFAGASIPGGQISWHRFGTWGCTYRSKPT